MAYVPERGWRGVDCETHSTISRVHPLVQGRIYALYEHGEHHGNFFRGIKNIGQKHDIAYDWRNAGKKIDAQENIIRQKEEALDKALKQNEETLLQDKEILRQKDETLLQNKEMLWQKETEILRLQRLLDMKNQKSWGKGDSYTQNSRHQFRNKEPGCLNINVSVLPMRWNLIHMVSSSQKRWNCFHPVSEAGIPAEFFRLHILQLFCPPDRLPWNFLSNSCL